jgi:hypothetical protein
MCALLPPCYGCTGPVPPGDDWKKEMIIIASLFWTNYDLSNHTCLIFDVKHIHETCVCGFGLLRVLWSASVSCRFYGIRSNLSRFDDMIKIK